MAENYVLDKGLGNWKFYIYHPEGPTVNTYKGKLEITKEFHTVTDNRQRCVVSVPNPNIAYVENIELLD